MRLDKVTYLAVQKIYYPGFTIGGIAEPVGIIVLLALIALTPYASTRFWWTVAAFLALGHPRNLLVRDAPGEQFLDQGHSADRHRRDVLFSPCRRHHWRLGEIA